MNEKRRFTAEHTEDAEKRKAEKEKRNDYELHEWTQIRDAGCMKRSGMHQLGAVRRSWCTFIRPENLQIF